EPMLWAIAISASVIAPCLVLSIWWRRTTLLASISGMLIPACILLAAFASRFETGFGLPWLKHAYTALGSYLAPNAGNLPVSIVAATIAMPLAICSIVAISFLTKRPATGVGRALMHHPDPR
ncbi:MAG: hypothetical protein AAF362_08640, partial [Pseudomonadota bacterium]